MRSKIAIKSIILAVLILLSILQVEKLWFENNSSHSFFSYVPKKQEWEIALQEIILEPKYIAVYHSENKGEYYELDMAGILFNSILKDSGKLIRRLPRMTKESYRYEDLFSKPHILFRFSVPISGDLIGQIAHSKEDSESFRLQSMAIVPAGLEESKFMLLFFSEDGDRSLAYSVAKTELQEENEVFSQYIGNKAMAGEKLLLSAKYQELSGFAGEVLLPEKKQQYILPREWKKEFAFLGGNSGSTTIDTGKLSEYLFAFVKNPKILWNITEEERVRYGDSSVLMEYTTQGVFTYRFIPWQETAKNTEERMTGDALNKAINFLEKDNLLSNQEIKLSAYRNEKGKHYFYFDYYFRGHPLIWKSEGKDLEQMKYPMEVVVEKDQVVMYRRVLLQSDYLLQQGTRFRVNYEDVLNAYYQKQDRAKVKDLYLGYVAKGKQIELNWVLETAQEQFIYPLNMEAGVNELE